MTYPCYLLQSVDQLERLQLDRCGSIDPSRPREQSQLQLDRAQSAVSRPSAWLQLDRLQLERL